MDLQSCTIVLWAQAEYFSTTATGENRKEGGEAQETGTDKSNFRFLTLLSPWTFWWAITKQTLIKLGFAADGVLQFVIKSLKACADSEWTKDSERQVAFF